MSKRKIKLIVSEIDGILTDGTYAEDEMGHVLYKRFNALDFSAINELKKNYKVVFISDDNHINYNICNRKNLPFYWAKNENEKYKALTKILHRYSCTPDEVIFIASKINDKKCIQMIPKSFCVEDAGEFLKSRCWASFMKKAGEGIFMELLYFLEIEAKNGKILE